MSMRNLTNAELAQILDKDIFHEISEAADALSVECYVVGGYVRDLFLERPSNDIDVVVVGSGIEVASALKKKLGKKAHSRCSEISEPHRLSIRIQKWSSWEHERKVTTVIRASRL